MGFISFDFRKEYLYFVLFWVMDFINSIFGLIQYGRYKAEYMIINFLCINIGELFSGFLIIYTKVKMNYLRENEIAPRTSNSLNKIEPELIYNDLSLKDNIFLLIFLASILDFLGRNYNSLFILFFGPFLLKPYHIRWIISVDILARIIFSRVILKYQLYKHHKVSIIICSIGFLIMAIITIQSIIFSEYNVSNSYIYLIFVVIQKFAFSLGDTLSKILLTDKFILPHYLMFYKSLLCFTFYLIYIPILFLADNLAFDHFKELFLIDNLNVYIFSLIFKIISSFFQSFSIFNIIYTFTPIHVGFLNVVVCLFELLISISDDENLLLWIFSIICLLIVMFGTLIFTEIIILNFCELNEYTKAGLLLKEQLDNRTPNATLLSDLEEEKEENNDSRNYSDLIKNRKVHKTMVYNYKNKI
jgi:hypothetical protein